MSLRVGMVSQWYDPEGGSAAQAGVIARALSGLGADVHVLTGYPNYPSGRLADGYRIRCYQREERDGVTVHRAPLWPNHDPSAIKRAGNYLSFAAGSGAVALTRFPDVDAVLVHSTPATAALPAMALNLTRGVPFVLHIQDLWPDSVLHSGFLGDRTTRSAARALSRMCSAIYRRAHSIAVTSPGMIDELQSRGVPEGKLHFVANWADESVFRPAIRDGELASALGIGRPFNVMYAGNLGPYQGLETFIAAAKRLEDRADIGFVIVGEGVQEPKLRSLAEGVASVTFVPPQPFDAMTDILALSNVQLVSLQDLPVFQRTLPSKIQASLAAAQPLLAAVTGDAARVVRESGAGVVVPPGDAQAMAVAIRELADATPAGRTSLGARGRDYYDTHFRREVSAARLFDLLRAATRSRERM